MDQAGVGRAPWPARAGAGLRRAWPALYAFYLFTRFAAFGFTALLPLLGAGSAGGPVDSGLIVGLLAVAFAFHVFAYVFNDVVDRAVDSTEPLKADFPLARGAMRPGVALAIALAQAPFAFALTAGLGGEARAFAWLAAAFALMTLYDLFGKRVAFPPLTDAAQGLGWAALVGFGAALTGGPPTALTWLLGAFVVVFIMLINGVHGSLRDLRNDLRCGARSTAILLGARPAGETGLAIPRRLLAYAVVLQAVLSLITLAPAALPRLGYPPQARAGMALLQAAIAALALYLLVAAVGEAGTHWSLVWMGMLHVVVALLGPIALLAPYGDRRLWAGMLAAYVGPLLTNEWLYRALHWGWRRLSRAEA